MSEQITTQEVFPEVAAAAKWWADILSTPDVPQDNGDMFQSAFVSFARESVSKLNADEQGVFERVLRADLQVYVLRNGWERAQVEPGWGSACRCIGVDYGPDRVLAAAIHLIVGKDSRQQARISLLWPIKTMMWVNPGEVTVRHGYSAQRKIIYSAKEFQPHECADATVSEKASGDRGDALERAARLTGEASSAPQDAAVTRAQLIAEYLQEYDRCVAGLTCLTAREYFEGALDLEILNRQANRPASHG